MPSVTGGGASNISGSQIVDGGISNVDIAADAAITLSKLAGLVGNPGSFISVETSDTSPYSLTTIANQRVIVIAKGSEDGANHGVALTYNGVTKDTADAGEAGGASTSFCLMYTEIPGAATANIVFPGTGKRLIVIKLMVG